MSVDDSPQLRLLPRIAAAPQLHVLPRLARRLRCGRLRLTLPDGRTHMLAGREPGPSAELTVKRVRFLRRLLLGGALGFADAYIDGDVESQDLAALLALAAANEDALAPALAERPWVQLPARLVHRLTPNTRAGSRRNIAAHYDLGNAFYSAWLDASLTYSSAVFTQADEELDVAQREKYRRIAELADLRPEHRVLEIGCGWGGFALYAAGEIGCHVTAITISQAQYEAARERVRSAGLDDRVEVTLTDYRDTEGTFDRIVSIEMIEAVGEAWWPTFFHTLRDRLAAGGRAVLQAITIADAVFPQYRRRVDFIQRSIFPGGMLPAPAVIAEQAQRAGLAVADRHRYGAHYAETLRRWRAAFERAWPRIAEMGFDERFRRTWRYYLAYCEAGFDTGRIDLEQLALDHTGEVPA
ncbi:cyclopropane-fatty-acyl-phospholipid synthase [Limimonas halophila]|uniref:Cyclopropane-fatty-acyl-phospholipid synthase n=1 Tax=Limimonas halophila TaxID=1082479 RepID=A0A1G7NYB7_9PROT|nr:cyclopropane-fatty-acyl-phospholipid synthase family protein [Limimonas halophila]SDF78951.1 cyclopropane-fatty-acyl-phospholipid synthase [Limimonas halophila]